MIALRTVIDRRFRLAENIRSDDPTPVVVSFRRSGFVRRRFRDEERVRRSVGNFGEANRARFEQNAEFVVRERPAVGRRGAVFADFFGNNSGVVRRREGQLFERPAFVRIVIVDRADFDVAVRRAKEERKARLPGFLVLFGVNFFLKVDQILNVLLFAEGQKEGAPTEIVAGVRSVGSRIGEFAGREGADRIGVIERGDPELAHIARTGHAPSRFSRRLNRRKEEPDQDSDNRDHDEQFDQRKTAKTSGKGRLFKNF